MSHSSDRLSSNRLCVHCRFVSRQSFPIHKYGMMDGLDFLIPDLSTGCTCYESGDAELMSRPLIRQAEPSLLFALAGSGLMAVAIFIVAITTLI